jgi:hypothetical protein
MLAYEHVAHVRSRLDLPHSHQSDLAFFTEDGHVIDVASATTSPATSGLLDTKGD